MSQLPLLREPGPDLASYDVILVNSSAGKDSQAMLDVVVEQARAAGVAARVQVVHCDLGRVEWKGTRELAEVQARHYGVAFHAVTRTLGDLLAHILARRLFPGHQTRYCTADHKRAQVHKLMTELARRHRLTGGARVRILNCLGMRADESPSRAKLVLFGHDERASNGRRHIDTWHPVHAWTKAQVWARIKASGVPHHPAYDLGMPRLSCCFCIFAPREALILAGRHNRELLAEYVRVEKEIGHRFRMDLSLEEVLRAVDAGEVVKEVPSWSM